MQCRNQTISSAVCLLPGNLQLCGPLPDGFEPYIYNPDATCRKTDTPSLPYVTCVCSDADACAWLPMTLRPMSLHLQAVTAPGWAQHAPTCTASVYVACLQ